VDTTGDDVDIYMDYLVGSLSSGYYERWFQKILADSPCIPDYGELGDDILRQMKYVDVNLIMTVVDLMRAKAEAESWMALSKKLAEYPKYLLKRVGMIGFKYELRKGGFPELLRRLPPGARLSSNAFLGQRYGILPTIGDFEALIGGITKIFDLGNSSNRLHSRRTSFEAEAPLNTGIDSTSTLTVELDSFPRGFMGGVMSLISEFKKWGMYPSFELLWDIVPYSFAVDWFTSINKTLAGIDQQADLDYYPIQYAISTQKRTWSPPVGSLWPGFPVTGEVQFKYYNRSISQELPIPSIVVGKQTPVNVKAHWLEATALVVQKIL
jgi:hypothetical protein